MSTQTNEGVSPIERLFTGSDIYAFEYNKTVSTLKWPELSELQLALMARTATELQLDVLREEVIWLETGPYITIRGLLQLMNRHPQFDNYNLEPASEEVRLAMRTSREEEQVWVCRLWRKDRTRPAIGYGRASPEDTFVGYGRIDGEPGEGQRSFRTPAVAEMAQERAVRHAAQSAFAWESMSTLPDPASPAHKRVDPDTGEVSQELHDGTGNTAGCTAAQRRCIHALAAALYLPEGRVDRDAGDVQEDGWRADMYRLYGKTSTMQLTASEAREFIDSLTTERLDVSG